MISQTIKPEDHEIHSLQLSAAFTGTDKSAYILEEFPSSFDVTRMSSPEDLLQHLNQQSILTLPDIILMETDAKGECFEFIKKIKANPFWRDLIIVLIATEKNKDWKSAALKLKVHDYYILPFPIDHLIERLNFLVKFKLIKPQLSVLKEADITYKLPLGKKVFDILVSTAGLLVLSPILLVTALIIKLDSKGPVFYKSKRVGTGYKIFDFYRFRSTQKDSESESEDFTGSNRILINGGTTAKTAFLNRKGDNKVTRFGEFIKRTSIDELPQLFNVIRGDMSLVGNRPLPLDEARMLTSNEWSQRFMGPAGVTGLWQIKSRGSKDVSVRERNKFDNFYASRYSFLFDLEILIKTVPVIFHKEKN